MVGVNACQLLSFLLCAAERDLMQCRRRSRRQAAFTRANVTAGRLERAQRIYKVAVAMLAYREQRRGAVLHRIV